MIANKVYAGRMGNGPSSTNDGAKFIGRGYIQCTGRETYRNLTQDLGVDFLIHPELLETVKYAALSAGWFWNRNNLNSIADRGKDDETIRSITKRINGGVNGLESRIVNFKLCEKMIQ